MKRIEDTHTDPVIDVLDGVRQVTGYGWARTFEDWVRVVFASLQRDDDAHGSIVEEYGGEYDDEVTDEVFEQFSAAFGELVVGTHETEGDVLGEVHQKTELGSDESGQYFTDRLLSDTISSMILPDADGVLPDAEAVEAATPEDPYTIADPAGCGSGRLLVSAGRRIGEMEGECPALFVGQDIDPTCARMTAINLALHGLPGVVVRGDTFDPDPVASWEIRPEKGMLGAPIREVDAAPFAITASE